MRGAQETTVTREGREAHPLIRPDLGAVLVELARLAAEEHADQAPTTSPSLGDN